jgi:hypothetical protein
MFNIKKGSFNQQFGIKCKKENGKLLYFEHNFMVLKNG